MSAGESVGQFVHLHLHTQYSLLDGANKISAVVERASQYGQPAIAMTDHGNLCGAIEFYSAAKKAGIKPIIGCEFYVTPTSRFDRRTREKGGDGTYHLTVLSMNEVGYRNICRLSSLAYKEGFYFKPRVDHELLERYNEGLIVTSGCLAGELNSFLEVDDIENARKLAEFYYRVFKDRFYFEVQPHQILDQQKLNKGCVELAESMGIPLVATTDCHYIEKEDHFAQEVLMCISTGKLITDPSRIRHDGFALHLKTAQEMYAEFGDFKHKASAIAASCEIAERCNLDFKFNVHYMPKFETPDTRPLIEIMASMAREGLKRRFEQLERADSTFDASQRKRYEERLELEISLVDKMGFAGYFLVVADFIVFAKESGIPVGPGRGSCAGSLVAYALRITELDPIKNKLLFERFLNPERISLPDIDVDFCIQGRDKVIRYVVEKYGAENVAQIATFGTLKAKAAIKDVGRVLGLSYAETDRVAQLVPAPRQGFDYPLSEAIKMEPRLAEYAKNEGKELVSLALKLEGLTRHSSTHAAGVVIGDRPLMELLPMMVDKDGKEVTQYSMSYVEKIGLVKFDFLGLKTLTVIKNACDLIKQGRGIEIDPNEFPLDDPKTYSLLCAGNTTGVFQLESTGITEMTVRLKPNCFDDLVAILALYRPGPLDAGMVDHYIERKHGREKVSHLHPLMQDTLADTYGIMIYQEQIMQLARELAGYSLAEADILRKAMGKKNPEEMAKQRIRFIEGAGAKGIEKKLADEIFDQMETFARYGFNRSHSAAYALISFQTAYLKAHYNVEFMAALMNNELDDSDKTLKNLNECRKQKIVVLPPDVNISQQGFSVTGHQIRYGMEALKGVGEKAVVAIIAEREQNGSFDGLEDFLERVDLGQINRRVIESLIKCGAFDSVGGAGTHVSRRSMYERLEDLLRIAQSLSKNKDSNQMSLFGDVSEAKIPRRQSNTPEWPINQKLAYEREALGFYISGHPLEKFRSELKKMGALSSEDIKGAKKKQSVKMAGVVTALKLKNTKKGDRYASFTFEDWIGTIEALVWPDVYRQFQHLLVADDPVLVSGTAEVSEERSNLIVDKIESLIALRDRSATQGVLALNEEDQFESRAQRLIELFQHHQGSCPVRVRLEMRGAEVVVQLKDQRQVPICVEPSETLCEAVEQVFGRPVLHFV